VTDELILRTRPSVVEAKRVTKETRDAVLEWLKEGEVSAWSYGQSGVTWHQGGTMHDAYLGEWVVRNPWGEFQRVSDQVLFSRFESVVQAVAE
jgi:hypothetical protein